MNVGEVREAVGDPKLFGVVPINRLGDDRKVVVQVYKGEHPEWDCPVYEYYKVDAVGTLFFDGEFTMVIAAKGAP